MPKVSVSNTRLENSHAQVSVFVNLGPVIWRTPRTALRCRKVEVFCVCRKKMSTFRQFGQRFARLAAFAVNKLSSGRFVGRIFDAVVRSTGRAGTVILRRTPPPAVAQRQAMVIRAVRAGIQRSTTMRGTWLGRILGNSLRSNSRAAFWTNTWFRGGVRNQRVSHHRISLSAALAGFAYANKDVGVDGVFERVRVRIWKSLLLIKTISGSFFVGPLPKSLSIENDARMAEIPRRVRYRVLDGSRM